MFYPQEEFERQMDELIATGMDRLKAYKIVKEREERDEWEYQAWLDKQHMDELNDSFDNGVE